MLRKRKIDVACVQETKWKGQKSTEKNGYKLWYSGSDGKRNGVGIMVTKELQDKVVEVKRCNDRIMAVRLVVGDGVVTIVCAYAPQVGLGELEKKDFWECLDELWGVYRESRRFT